MTDTQEQWTQRMRRIDQLIHDEEWSEAREAVEQAKQLAPTEHHLQFAIFQGCLIDLLSSKTDEADLEQDLEILTRALEALEAIPAVDDENDNRYLDFLQAETAWVLVQVANTLDAFDSPEEFQQLEHEARKHMVEMGRRWARPLVLGESEELLAKLPTWQRPIVDHVVVALARLKAIHEIDPEIVKRPIEMVEMVQREASLSLSIDHESYEAMLAANMASEEDRREFARDFQSRLTAWRARPLAPELERLFETCWAENLTDEHQELIRKEVSERFVRAFVELIPAFVEHHRARKPEAKARSGVALLAHLAEAAYQPLLRGLLDLSSHAIGSPRSTEKMSLGTLVDAAMNLSAPTSPGLRAVAMPKLVTTRNAVSHIHYDVTPRGDVTLWGGGPDNPDKKLGPLDLDALDALITEARETCLTISLAFSLLIHPDIPHLGRPQPALGETETPPWTINAPETTKTTS